MKHWAVVTAVALSVVGGMYGDAQGARGYRPLARRYCAGVTQQPCPPAGIRAPQSQETVTTYVGCTCAFFKYAQQQGYSLYYAGDFYPDCNTAYWCSLAGNFDTTNPNPCPTCPSSQCVGYYYEGSLGPDRKYFKPGTRLEKKLNWNEKLVLNSGTAKLKTPAGVERTMQIETKELTDSRMLVSFTQGNNTYYAKLHVCRVEATDANTKVTTISDFASGQEISAPPAGQKVTDVTEQIKVLDTNVATIKIGTTTYQVVTATPLAE